MTKEYGRRDFASPGFLLFSGHHAPGLPQAQNNGRQSWLQNNGGPLTLKRRDSIVTSTHLQALHRLFAASLSVFDGLLLQ